MVTLERNGFAHAGHNRMNVWRDMDNVWLKCEDGPGLVMISGF